MVFSCHGTDRDLVRAVAEKRIESVTSAFLITPKVGKLGHWRRDGARNVTRPRCGGRDSQLSTQYAPRWRWGSTDNGQRGQSGKPHGFRSAPRGIHRGEQAKCETKFRTFLRRRCGGAAPMLAHSVARGGQAPRKWRPGRSRALDARCIPSRRLHRPGNRLAESTNPTPRRRTSDGKGRFPGPPGGRALDAQSRLRAFTKLLFGTRRTHRIIRRRDRRYKNAGDLIAEGWRLAIEMGADARY